MLLPGLALVVVQDKELRLQPNQPVVLEVTVVEPEPEPEPVMAPQLDLQLDLVLEVELLVDLELVVLASVPEHQLPLNKPVVPVLVTVQELAMVLDPLLVTPPVVDTELEVPEELFTLFHHLSRPSGRLINHIT